MSDHQKLISDIQGEINELRKTQLYLEQRILRKCIMIDELMTGRECAAGAAVEPHIIPLPPSPLFAPPVPAGKKVSVTKMVCEALEQVNGRTFDYGDIKKVMLAKHPGDKVKISRGIYPAFEFLLQNNTITRDVGGFRKTYHSINPQLEAAAR